MIWTRPTISNEQALDRLPIWDLGALRGEALISGPTGRLLLRAAERTLTAKRPRRALHLLDEALSVEIDGPGSYPEADVYRLRAEALEALTPVPSPEVARAAIEAGRRCFWGRSRCAKQ